MCAVQLYAFPPARLPSHSSSITQTLKETYGFGDFPSHKASPYGPVAIALGAAAAGADNLAQPAWRLDTDFPADFGNVVDEARPMAPTAPTVPDLKRQTSGTSAIEMR